MGWQTVNGGRFLYLAERQDGRVVKTYVGPASSKTAQLVGRVDRSQRAIRRLNHAAETADEAADRDRKLRAYDVRSALITKLFRRGLRMKLHTSSGPGEVPDPPVDPVSDMPTHAEFLALVSSADKGGLKAQAELRGILDRHPEVWRRLGDLGRLVESQLIALASQGHFLLQESIPVRLAELRKQLCKTPDDPLESLLVDRVGVSWLEVEVRQIQVLEAKGEMISRKQQRRLDQAQRRHIDAICALREFQRSVEVGGPVTQSPPTAPAADAVAIRQPEGQKSVPGDAFARAR